MKHKKSLPPFAIFASLSFSLFFGLVLFQVHSNTDFYSKYLIIFVLSASLTLVAFNWQILSTKGEKRFYSWLAIAGILILGLGMLSFNLIPSEGEYSYNLIRQQNSYLVFFLFNAVLVSAFLLSLFNLSQPHLTRDENFNQTSHHFLFNSLIYGGFSLILTIILFLGFSLLNLIGFDLWKILGDFGQSMVIGLMVGTTLLFLNLIPSFSTQRRPPTFLFVFPSIILGFIAIYLLALPFTDIVKIKIDSAIRLSTAGILWLFLIYLNDPKRCIFNAITSAAGLILTVISLRGMMIRIDEYGLTLDRIYAQIVVIILLLGHGFIFIKALTAQRFPKFSSYCLSLMMVCFLTIFVLSAFIPAIRWSLESQITRYTTGKGDINKLQKYDFSQFGQAGEKALSYVRTFHKDNPQILAKIDYLNKDWQTRQKENEELFLKQINRIPADLVLSESVIKKLSKYSDDDAKRSIIFNIDADHDGNNELLAMLARSSKEDNMILYKVFAFLQPEDKNIKILDLGYVLSPDSLVEKIQNGQWQYQKPRFDDIKIEGIQPIYLPSSK